MPECNVPHRKMGQGEIGIGSQCRPGSGPGGLPVSRGVSHSSQAHKDFGLFRERRSAPGLLKKDEAPLQVPQSSAVYQHSPGLKGILVIAAKSDSPDR